MSNPAPIIQLRNVSVTFGRQPVLRDLSFDIHAHETVALIGESGCGKSVTLKLIVGLLAPTQGEILFEGQSLRQLPERKLSVLRRRIGFLFQQSALFDSLSVFDNVAFGPRTDGKIRQDELSRLVRDRLRDVGLSEAVESKMPADLSGGMRKRVALARALALNPDVMLYDEPTTGLDPIMTDVINELILVTSRRQQTTAAAAESPVAAVDRPPVTSLVVTHEMRTVQKVADRVLMIQPLAQLAPDEPQLIYDGLPDGLALSADRRVRNFVEGNARDRLAQLSTD